MTNILIVALIFVLHEAYTLGSDKLPAPQGQALASMVSGIVGGEVPAQKYLAGAGLGALLSIAQPVNTRRWQATMCLTARFAGLLNADSDRFRTPS